MSASESRVLYNECHPILNVRDVAASLKYYCDKLGYEVGFSWPVQCEWSWMPRLEPTFAQVNRGKSTVMLAKDNQGSPGMWIYLGVDSLEDLEALHQEYLKSGAIVVQPPTDKPWNMREMFVEDVDGHTLRIGAALPE